MGATGSTPRSVSIDNDLKDTSVIKISEGVVDRLKSGVSDDEEEEFFQQKAQVRKNKSTDRSDSSTYNIFDDNIPFVTARMIRQEIENEVEKNNKYWERRISALQENNEKLNCIMETEYLRSVEELKKELPALPPEFGILPCQEKKKDIIRCYKMHGKKPLLCAQEVEAFACCMTSVRKKLQTEGKLGY